MPNLMKKVQMLLEEMTEEEGKELVCMYIAEKDFNLTLIGERVQEINNSIDDGDEEP